MKFTIHHPTARVKGTEQFHWLQTCWKWHDCCDDPSRVEYIVIVHISRVMEFWLGFAGTIPNWGRFTVVVNDKRDCLVDQCNAGALAVQLSPGILVGIQDDLFPPNHWDTSIGNALPNLSEPCVLQCWSGSKRDSEIFIPTVYTRPMLRKIGLVPTEYESMYSDVEMCFKARNAGRVIVAPKTERYTFEHRHPAFNKSEMDAVYASENSKEAYESGKKVLESRAALGFPRVPFPDESEGETPAPMRSIAFMFPGETFRFEWLAARDELGIAVGNQGWYIQKFLGYCSSVYSTRCNMTEELMEKAKIVRPDYVFWLDDDNLIKPEQFLGLVSFLETHPGADGIVGWCWIRQKERWGTSVANFWPDDGVHLAPLELPQLFENGTTPKRIETTGFPAVLLRYSAVEKLGPHAFRPIVKADLPSLGFLTEAQIAKVPDHWFAGEDSAWCLRAKAAGLQLWVDPSCKVAHLKMISQEPDVQLYADTPQDLKDWRAKVNGAALKAPPNFEQVIS